MNEPVAFRLGVMRKETRHSPLLGLEEGIYFVQRIKYGNSHDEEDRTSYGHRA